ncbi:hypothetical protein ACIGO9_28870 [Nocardia asteroides]|uniref:hypothetical protein n=1 Tax=Nocardia asteroides TaxID=1824 RepID=UPI0037C72292
MSPEQHPWVVWAAVISAVIALVAATIPRVREIVGPVFGFVSNYRVRRIQRQARIEAAAAALNDERNRLLSIQLAGVASQLDNVLRQTRAADERHQNELAELRNELSATKAQLAAATAEVAALRAELAEYRKADGK